MWERRKEGEILVGEVKVAQLVIELGTREDDEEWERLLN